MNWPWTKSKPEPKIEVVRIASIDLRLEDWRRNPQLITAARKIVDDPTFKMMLDVLENESPANYYPPTEGQNPNKDLNTLGKIRGYGLALNNLRMFAVPMEKRKPLVATFAQPPETESKE